MKIPTKKLKSGFKIPVYGLGTWKMGGGLTRDPNNNDNADINAIKYAIESGVTHIDTAEAYANGHAEKLVSKAIKDYPRKNLFLVSKVYSTNLKHDDLLRSAEGSLKRLYTDYLDLYLVHAPNDNIQLKETMRAMDNLVDNGRVKNIGVSNFSIEELEDAQSYTKNKIVTNQVQYSLNYRQPETSGLLKYCQENDIILTAYKPLEVGKLARYESRILDKLAKKYNKSRAQIAINWLISKPNVVAISKTGIKKHLDENLGAIGWKMEKDDLPTL
jgi:diketogulonate reductase-like aldo/keto reductase